MTQASETSDTSLLSPGSSPVLKEPAGRARQINSAWNFLKVCAREGRGRRSYSRIICGCDPTLQHREPSAPKICTFPSIGIGSTALHSLLLQNPYFTIAYTFKM